MLNKKKLFKIFIIIIVIVAAYEAIVRIGYNPNRDIKWGVAFSKPYAIYLGLDWQKLYSEIIGELKVKTIRLPIYWNDVELEKDNYNFSDYDWMMDTAKKNNVEIVLVVGQRLPRWPECHRPGWLNDLSQEDQNHQLRKWILKVVQRYKSYKNIIMWQVENEPYLTFFGECKKVDETLLKQEVAMMRAMDKRPILITDSGELSAWVKASKLGDYLGTTVYRTVHNRWFGYWSYSWLPASFYRFKGRINGLSWDKMVISELQTEPWYPSGTALDTSLDEQFKSMDVARFKSSIAYGKKIGFPQVYLWGVEWWGWLKEKQGNDTIWEEAKKVFNKYFELRN